MLIGRWQRVVSWVARAIILAAALGAVSAVLAAQAASAQNATPQSSEPPQANGVIRTQTNLVLVRVIVRDANGNPVTTLEESDFQLFDDKKRQKIAYFSAEEANPRAAVAPPASQGASTSAPSVAPSAAPPPAASSRYAILFFDDFHMDFGDLVQVRKAAQDYIAQSIHSGARVAIVSASGKPSQEFTSDPEKLAQALAQIHFDQRFQAHECPKMPVYFAQQVIDDISVGSSRGGGSSGNVNAAVGLNDPIELAKTLATSQRCPAVQLGSDDDIQTRARNIVLQNHLGVETMLRILEHLVVRLSETPGDQRTLAIVSSGFYDKTMQSDLDRVIDRALRANVVVNALDARGLFALPPGGDLTQLATLPAVQREMDSMIGTTRQVDGDGLNEVSEATGGVFIQNTNDLQTGLAKIAGVETPSYVLGFAPEGVKPDGRFHTIKVKIDSAPHYSIQARRGFFSPKAADAAANAARDEQEELESAAFSQQTINDLPIHLTTAFAKAGEHNDSLTVTVDADMHSVEFSKRAGSNADDMTLLVVLFDSDGNYVTARQQVTKLRLADAELQQLRKIGGETSLDLAVAPGVYRVRAVLRESVSNRMGAVTESVQIP